jgi:O-antigen/teichoic acid export membrane protein
MDRIAPDCARMSSNPLNVVRAATTFERRPLGVPSPGLRGRYLGAVTWSIAGLGVSRGATFLASMFTARLLGAESFGGFAIVQSTVSVAAAFAGAGLGVTASRYLAEFRASNPERAGRLLGLASAVALISGAALAFSTFTSAPFIAGHVLHAPALLLPLRIASLLVLFTALNGYQTGALAGLEAFRTMAMVNLCSGVVSCPVIIFGAYRGGISGAVWGLSAAMFATWALNQLTLRHVCVQCGITWAWRDCWSEAHLIYRTSLPVLLSSLIVVPSMWLCNYWVVQRPHGYQQLGIYTAADRYRLLLLFVPGAIGATMLPLLSSFRGGGDGAGFRKLLRANVFVISAIVSVPALFIALCARRAMGYFGPSYLSGAPILVVLSVSAIAESLNAAVGQAVLTSSAWRRFYFDVMLFSIICGAAYLLVPRLGALGLATAYLTGFTCTAAALLIYVRPTKIHPISVS